jgi:hypothetical protein
MKTEPLPRITTTAQILLLCSRETLTATQAELVLELCAQVRNWDDFLRQTTFRMVVPFVNRHFRQLQPESVPTDVLAKLHNRSRQIACQNLTMIAVQRRLVQDVLEPLGIPFLFFKGPTLAQRFYRDSMLRMCRDIDLLTPRRDMVRLGRRLRQCGYTAYPDRIWAEDDALHFRQRFSGMMDWLSPEGILIEMPTTLDAEWDRLPTDRLLANATSVEVGGVNIPVMPDPDFLAYLCRHHTRHHWARLHWIADLNVLLGTDEARRTASLERAQQLGLTRTVRAALAIDHAAAAPCPWQARFDDPFAHEVFRHLLMNLNGDRATELRLRDQFTTTDMDIAQPARWCSRKARSLIGRFRPSTEDFEHMPLSARRHSLYYLLRPFLWLSRKLSSVKHDPAEGRLP